MNRFLAIGITTVLILLISTSIVLGTGYEYDTLNRLTKVTYDGGFQIVYSYDEVGNRTERIATIAPDIFADGIVNMQDLAALGDYWMENNCGIPDWCDRVDIDESGFVEVADLGNIAEFWLKQSSYTVTASVIGGHGSVSPASGSYIYGYESITNLIASPDSGYQVLSWTGTDNDSSRSQNNTATVNETLNVQVQFEPLYVLTASVIGGYGSVSPISGNYEYGNTVNLIASPDSGYQVLSWTGTDNDSSRSQTNTATVLNGSQNVQVQFEPLYNLTTSVIDGNGTLSPVSGSYEYGTVVNLVAAPDNNYMVKAWTGTDNDSSKNTNNTITMNTSRNTTVEFEYNPFPNGGFEMGDFSYWDINGDVWIDSSLTEGSYAASLFDGYGRTSSLSRVISLPDANGYTISFDYFRNGSGSAYVLINGQQYPLISDEQVHTFTQNVNGVNSFTLQIIAPGGSYAYVIIDNFVVVNCPNCQVICGDGICDPGEETTCSECWVCGNGRCDPGEEETGCSDCFINGGFELGDLTYWNVISGYYTGGAYSEVYVNGIPLTEGNYAAYMSAHGGMEMMPGPDPNPENPPIMMPTLAEARLQKTIAVESSGTYRVCFDYLCQPGNCWNGYYWMYMAANDSSVELSPDGQIHSSQIDITATDSLNLEFYLQASGDCGVQMTVDNVRVFIIP